MAIAAENGASGALILPVDLPFITASDVTTVVNAGLENEHSSQIRGTTRAPPKGNGYHQEKERARDGNLYG